MSRAPTTAAITSAAQPPARASPVPLPIAATEPMIWKSCQVTTGPRPERRPARRALPDTTSTQATPRRKRTRKRLTPTDEEPPVRSSPSNTTEKATSPITSIRTPMTMARRNAGTRGAKKASSTGTTYKDTGERAIHNSVTDTSGFTAQKLRRNPLCECSRACEPRRSNPPHPPNQPPSVAAWRTGIGKRSITRPVRPRRTTTMLPRGEPDVGLFLPRST